MKSGKRMGDVAVSSDARLLTVFVPTYKRANLLDRLLSSIFLDNERVSNDINVVISSNSIEDEKSKNVVEKWKKKHDNIQFFCNKENVGLDGNHDLVYQYCDTPYALFLADDDYLMRDSLRQIIDGCANDYTFAIINSLPAPPLLFPYRGVRNILRCGIYKIKSLLGKITPIYKIKDELISGDRCSKIFSSKYFTPNILPLLPFYSGLLVNVEKVKNSLSYSDRYVFQGTLHQYIGTLWNATFESNGYIKLFEHPMIYISFWDNKTWTTEMDELIKMGLPRFYKSLRLPHDVQEHLLADMQQQVKKWKNN